MYTLWNSTQPQQGEQNPVFETKWMQLEAINLSEISNKKTHII